MSAGNTAIDHAARRLVVALPRPYDAARSHYETLVPEVDSARFFQMASWQATLELAEINAPHGFMRYYRSDITAAMAGSPSFWKATQYLMGNHTIAERMFRYDPSVVVVEYLLIAVFSAWGLIWVLGHHAGTFHITSAWFSLHGIGGKGSLAAGFLIAVFMYTGWDGTLYVNEEVRHRRVNPGRAAMIAVTVAAGIFILAQVGLQGVVSPSKLQANSSSILGYLGQVIGGNVGGKALALALALSVIAATGAGILLTARILYGMASHRVLPSLLGNVSPRFSTPVAATVLSGLVLIVLAWVNLLTTSVQGAFNNVLNETGILYATFYMLTALAAIVYYRRRVVSSVSDAITLGILPLGSIAFLGWVVVKFMQGSTASENWSLGGVVAVGAILMVAGRFVLRSPFFQIKRESDRQAQ
jgi:amino acid transporter